MAYHHKRKLINMLLKPAFQLKFGFYFFVFSIVSSLLVQWLVFVALRNSVAEYYVNNNIEEVAKWLDPSMTSLGWEYFLFLGVFATLGVLFGVYITHKVIGPVVALRRLIKDLKNGDYGNRVQLRKGDQLLELADDLNELSAVLRERHQVKKDKVVRLNQVEEDEKPKEKKSA